MATNLFQELKRRKVVRTAVAYAVVGFGVITVAETTFEYVGLPNWGVTLVIVLVALAFPLVLVLSWMFDITPEGIERTAEVAGATTAESSSHGRTPAAVIDPERAGEAVHGSDREAPADTLQIETPHTVKPRTESQPLPSKPSLAIVPFVNLSGDPEQDYFAHGLSADIGADLVKISGLFLISQSGVQPYANRNMTPSDFRRVLGVGHLLEGTVRRAGDKIRITSQLVDTESSEPVWGDRFEGDMDDLFDFHDRIVEEIVTELEVTLVHGEGARIFRRSFKNPKARDLCYRALPRVWSSDDRVEFLEVQRLLEEAGEIEPDSPWPPVYAAWSHYMAATRGLRVIDEDSIAAAWSLADKAIELGDPSGMAYMLKALIHLLRREHDQALEFSERALHERPGCPWSYVIQGNIFNYSGRPAEAIPLARQASRRSPVYPTLFPAALAMGHYLCEEPDMARDAARHVIEQLPDDLDTQVMLLAATTAQGRDTEARAALEEIRRISTDFSLDQIAAEHPFRDPAVLNHLLDELRAGGLS